MSKGSPAKNYQKTKEGLNNWLLKGIKNFQKKKKKRQYGLERYKNLPEGENQKLVVNGA